MEIFQAIILGIIEGLTEFLPISSTGHLIVSEDIMNYYDASKLFTVVIQIGAILAVIWFYRKQLMAIISGLLKGSQPIRRFFLLWVIATIPAGILGLLFNSKIDSLATTFTVAWSFILGGIAIWLIENYHKSPKAEDEPNFKKLTMSQSVQIGLYQAIALIPGVSRSGATIMGGLLSGLDRVTATAFSFYLSIPILLLAGGYKLATGDIASVEGGGLAIIFGLIASFFTALLAISWLLKYVSNHDFKPFAYYRIAMGLLILILSGLSII